jgi:hypothetical protein
VAALAALSAIRKPWPAPLAAELLLLQAKADFAAGRTLDGIHAFEERGLLLGAADERAQNYRLLVDALQRGAATGSVPAGATDSDRGWIELAQLSTVEGQANVQRVGDWRARHPNHPGSALLPRPGPATTVASQVAVAPAPASGPAAVALLLPLSGRQQAVGVAVRDGFIAGYLAQPDSAPRVLAYDTAALGAAPAYEKAIADGASFVVGPLAREDVAALVAQQRFPVPTLVLNSYGGTPPAFLFQFTLDPEQEARDVARRIAADGRARGIALFPRSPWGERLYTAFTSECQALGIELTGAQYYEPGTRDFSGPLRAALGRFGGAGDRSDRKPPPHRDSAAEAREGPQFAFIAATPQAARTLRPRASR